MTVELSADLWNATDWYTANVTLLDEGICEEFQESTTEDEILKKVGIKKGPGIKCTWGCGDVLSPCWHWSSTETGEYSPMLH